jgi:hypothetical protein
MIMASCNCWKKKMMILEERRGQRLEKKGKERENRGGSPYDV